MAMAIKTIAWTKTITREEVTRQRRQPKVTRWKCELMICRARAKNEKERKKKREKRADRERLYVSA